MIGKSAEMHVANALMLTTIKLIALLAPWYFSFCPIIAFPIILILICHCHEITANYNPVIMKQEDAVHEHAARMKATKPSCLRNDNYGHLD